MSYPAPMTDPLSTDPPPGSGPFRIISYSPSRCPVCGKRLVIGRSEKLPVLVIGCSFRPGVCRPAVCDDDDC